MRSGLANTEFLRAAPNREDQITRHDHIAIARLIRQLTLDWRQLRQQTVEFAAIEVMNLRPAAPDLRTVTEQPLDLLLSNTLLATAQPIMITELHH